MASFSNVILVTLVLSLRQIMASPIPNISSPDVGQLSFPELTQQTLSRILDLGFRDGIACSLLILVSLVCVLICFLSALATYIDHKEVNTAETQDYDHGHAQYTTKESIPQHPRVRCQFSPRTQSRLSRYIFSSPSSTSSSPLTKITIRTSSSRRAKSTPPSSPPFTPLRSALSKSSPTRLSTAQAFLFGTRRRSSPSSHKSVRWADNDQVSVYTVEVCLAKDDLESDEFDIGTTCVSGAVPSALSGNGGDREILVKHRSRDYDTPTRVSTFKIEGDTC